MWFVVGFVAVGAWTGSAWWGLAAGVAGYVASVQARPWTGCWWCHESPKRRDKGGANWMFCMVCGGSGRRRRLLAIRRSDG